MPESSTHLQPSQSVRPKPTPGPIPGQMEHMAQMLAAALQQPRESGISIERARKLGAKPYDGSGNPKRFPKSFRDAKVEEFYRLAQGDFSVPKYEKKFSELIRLVPFFAENEQ